MGRTVAIALALTILCASPSPAPTNTPPPEPALMQLDAGAVHSFVKCTHIGSETEVITFVSGNSNVVSKLPGRTTYGNINCSRGFSSDLTIGSWRHAVETGDSSAIRGGTLTLFDQTLTPLATFSLINAWPNSLYVNSVDNGAGGLTVTEDFSIVVDRVTRP